MANDSSRNRKTYQLVIDSDLDAKIQRFYAEFPDVSLAQLARDSIRTTLDGLFRTREGFQSGKTDVEVFAAVLAAAVAPLLTTNPEPKGEKGSKRKPRS